ncbi:MAG: DUF1972 domain-containing protein [Prochloraceae cyanobacterium]
MKNKILFLGIRGIPAKHGGFETFAQRLALYLVDRGWDVTVYCQIQGEQKIVEKKWMGINLICIPVKNDNALASIVFDYKATLDSLKREGQIMLFGYNTAIFSLLHRLKKRISIINMDGLEWRRQKWGNLEKAWLYANEHFGAWFNRHLIADHPEIKNYLRQYIKPEKITVIPYGSDPVIDADASLLNRYNLSGGEYALVIARAEPENSILEIVAGFSSKKRNMKLVVLGKYDRDNNSYQKQVLDAASEEVVFLGAIYDKATVQALRFYARLYVHGHTVGGTNPSLVEALAAGTPILAHDNRFNRWVAGDGASYFKDTAECDEQLALLLDNTDLLKKMKLASIDRYVEEFSEDKDLAAYEELFLSYLPEEKAANNWVLIEQKSSAGIR